MLFQNFLTWTAGTDSFTSQTSARGTRGAEGWYHYSQNQVLLAFTDPVFAKAQNNCCVNKQEALVKQSGLHVMARMIEAFLMEPRKWCSCTWPSGNTPERPRKESKSTWQACECHGNGLKVCQGGMFGFTQACFYIRAPFTQCKFSHQTQYLCCCSAFR